MTDPQDSFAARHLGPRQRDVAHMLDLLGYPTLDDLLDAAVPDAIRQRGPLELPAARTEPEVLAALRALAAENTPMVQMIGLGYHDTVTPAVIRRNVLESPAWYTAYTPYQPEISQGRLEALLTFQTMVEDLTALPVANASLLDEATAVAEAVMLMRRAVRGRPDGVVLLDADCLPQTIAVTRVRAEALGVPVVVVDLSAGLPADTGDVIGVVLSYPGASGAVRDIGPVIAQAKERQAMVTVATDLLALTLLAPPGELGADVAVGSAQRFGVPLLYGGPHAAFMAVRNGLERMLPGRLVGVSIDADGAPAYRLALQTREQHIRREKATSNICTAQALLAIVSAMYAVHHGPDGLRAIAARTHARAVALAGSLRALAAEGVGVAVEHEVFFDTVRAVVPGRAEEVVAAAAERGVNLWPADADHVQVACDETTTPQHLATVVDAFAAALDDVPQHTNATKTAAGHAESGRDALTVAAGDAGEDAQAVVGLAGDAEERGIAGRPSTSPASPAATPDGSLTTDLPAWARRTSEYLTHPVFHTHRSETAMLRYLRRLSDKDLALDRTMIPLGSCTMKLNAAVEMEAITWPGFAGIHPYVPADQARGYTRLIGDLADWLAEITGYDAVSLQPNAGSQGEFAGLLAIRRFHLASGQGDRDVCLIPASAHGTNAASAAMAGLRVVPVATAADGSIDTADLRAKLAEHDGRVAAVMITYPSTHGVYEPQVAEVCDLVHAAGGQVYIDGANLNALVGLARPGDFGGDVSHLNLHKTFAVPHGGGGPGVGPVAAKAHLAAYLPGHPLTGGDGASPATTPADARPGPVSAAPFGSAGVLPISWAYVALLGPDGLRAASATAVLSANYVAARLAGHFPVLYTGANGLVAHECILDLRELTKATGVTVEDVAKRLMDYGFHAPTQAFPVAGTLMVEPTESEDLGELDRFCSAMIAIRAEIDEIAAGAWPVADSPLRAAPHTAACLLADEWTRPYSRERAAYPLPGLRGDKYWPPVRRIDGAHGDRNLVCACPPVESYAQETL